jgi:hypothetical protein
LGVALKANKVLRSLDLGDNLLSDTGLTHVAAALSSNSVLTYLSVSGARHTFCGLEITVAGEGRSGRRLLGSWEATPSHPHPALVCPHAELP